MPSWTSAPVWRACPPYPSESWRRVCLAHEISGGVGWWALVACMLGETAAGSSSTATCPHTPTTMANVHTHTFDRDDRRLGLVGRSGAPSAQNTLVLKSDEGRPTRSPGSTMDRPRCDGVSSTTCLSTARACRSVASIQWRQRHHHHRPRRPTQFSCTHLLYLSLHSTLTTLCSSYSFVRHRLRHTRAHQPKPYRPSPVSGRDGPLSGARHGVWQYPAHFPPFRRSTLTAKVIPYYYNNPFWISLSPSLPFSPYQRR